MHCWWHIDNDEKVASSKNAPNLNLDCKNGSLKTAKEYSNSENNF